MGAGRVARLAAGQRRQALVPCADVDDEAAAGNDRRRIGREVGRQVALVDAVAVAGSRDGHRLPQAADARQPRHLVLESDAVELAPRPAGWVGADFAAQDGQRLTQCRPQQRAHVAHPLRRRLTAGQPRRPLQPAQRQLVGDLVEGHEREAGLLAAGQQRLRPLGADGLGHGGAGEVHQPAELQRRGDAVLGHVAVPIAQAGQRIEQISFGRRGGLRRRQRRGQEAPRQQRDGLGLDATVVVEGQLRPLGQQRADAADAIIGQPFARQPVGVAVAGHAVVGRGDEALQRVDITWQFVEGDEPVPGEVIAPAGHGRQPIAVAPPRDKAGHHVGNRAGRIGVDDVLAGERPVAQALAEALPAGGPVRGQHGPQVVAGAEERPVVGQVGMVAGDSGAEDSGAARQQVGEDRAVARGADGDDHVAQAADADDLLSDLGRLPRAVDLVARGVVGVEALDVDVLHVGESVGDAPGAMLVVADDDAGHAGQGEAGNVVIAAAEVIGVPDGREDGRQVGVVGQLRPAAGGARPADNPVVAAQALAHERRADRAVGNRLAERAQQPFGQAAADGRVGDGRQIVRAVDRRQVGGALRPQLVEKPGAQQFRLPVARQPPGQHRAPGAGGQGIPRLGAKGQQAELGRQRLGGDEGIDAGAIGGDDRGRRGVAQVGLGAGGARPAQIAGELVEGDAQWAGHLGQSAQSQPPVEIHLEEAILRLDVALGEEEVVVVGGVDVGHAPLVANDLHRGVQAIEDGASAGFGHGAAHQPARGHGQAQRAGGGNYRQGQPPVERLAIRRVP